MKQSFIDSTGHERFFGNILVEHSKLMKFPVYGDTPTAPMISRSEWGKIITEIGNDFYSPHLPPVHDQDGIGQCNADATTGMGEYQRSAQGLPYIELSAADLYDRINGGSDRGSLLEDALGEMMKNGVGTAATCGTLWKREMKRATAEERSRFKFLEVYLCPTFDHIMSALMSGFAVNSGILWYDNFNPDGDGFLPARGSGQPGGHSTMLYKPRMDKSGKFGAASLNSWSEGWGIKGCFATREEHYQSKQVGGWFAVRGIVDEGGIIPTPKD